MNGPLSTVRPTAASLRMPASSCVGRCHGRCQMGLAAVIEGQTALYLAASNGYHATVRPLAELGADVNTVCSKGSSPLHTAAVNGHYEAVRVLVKGFGAEVNAKNSAAANRTPLHLAVTEGHYKVVSWLVNEGADVGTSDRDGMTPLHHAASSGRHLLTQLLIAKGADVGATNNNGWTPFICAERARRYAITRVLAEAGGGGYGS